MTDLATSSSIPKQERPPLYRDVTVVKWTAQLVALAVVVFSLWFLINEAGTNLAARDISTSFDFMSENPGFLLSDTIDNRPDTGGRALWAGMVTTLRLAAAGIVAATILGILVGLARLSSNWIVNKVGSVFVEAMRNTPLLVFMIVVDAIFASINNPVTADMGPINGWFHASSKGISIPRPYISDGFYQWMILMLVGAALGRYVFRARQAYQDRTGNPGYPWLSAMGLMVVFAGISWLAHPIFGWLDGPLRAISNAISAIPEQAVQAALTIGSLAFAAIWINRFLNSRRTPAGLAKLSDDDWYRMVFAGFAGLAASFVFLVLWPGLSSWMVNSGSDLFGVLADKFDPICNPVLDATGDAIAGQEVCRDRTGAPFGASKPDIIASSETVRFAQYGPSGFNMSKGFAVVFLSIWLNTSAFIGEIVRGGILAVSKGQTEAAAALGLKRSQALRQVILPQAFRVVLPPLGNQYLNLTKNTTLAFVVGFSDMFSIGQTLVNQTGRVIPVLIITMLFYLACSLTISVVVNFFNVRLKIVER